MDHWVPVASEAERAAFCAPIGPVALDPAALDAPRADAHWLLLADGEPAARCSLWWHRVPAYLDHHLGVIGHYAARDATAASALLRLACTELAAQGCSLAIGPMDGSTYHRYRLVTERGIEPPFFLEPDNPDDWPAQYTANGFSPLAHYCSALQSTLELPDAHLAGVARRVKQRGIRIRPLDLDHFEQDVRALHAVATAGFASGFLHTPVDAESFVQQYEGLRSYVTPDLVLIAEAARVPVGLLLLLPDWLQARRGQRVDTLVLKTVAVQPDYAGHGLVGALVAHGQLAARQLGYTRVIHALMHERNASVRLSGRADATRMRRYALYAKPLRRP